MFAMLLGRLEKKAPKEQYAEDYHNRDDDNLHQGHCATSMRTTERA